MKKREPMINPERTRTKERDESIALSGEGACPVVES
jgi:hypothetical protein